MTWTRYFTTGWEDKYLGGVEARYGGQYNLPRADFFNDTPYTGNYSLDFQGDSLGVTISIYPAVTQVRMSCKQYWVTPYLSDTVVLGVAGEGLPATDRAQYQWIYDESEGNWDIREDGIHIDTVSPYPTDFSFGAWQTFALTAKAGVGGYVSFYHNGDRVWNTTAPTLNNITTIYLPGYNVYTSTLACRIDDIYIDTGDGTESDAVPYSLRFYPLPARNEGTHTQWTAVGARTKTEIANGKLKGMEQAQFLHTSHNNRRQMFYTTNVRGHDEYEINAILVRAVAKAGADINNPVLHLALHNGGHEDLSPAFDLTWGYEVFDYRFDTRPDGDPFDHDFSDIQFGVKSS